MNSSNYNTSIASKYDRLRSWRGAVPERIVELARIEEKSQFLDIACGTGNLGLAIRKVVPCSVTGIDLSMDMIRHAAPKMPEESFVRGDVTAMPFASGAFDAVAGSFFLHHVAPEARQGLVDECHRILRKGWIVLVTTSHADIERNPMARFFEEFVGIDKGRFPDVGEICGWMERAAFHGVQAESVSDGIRWIDSAYADWVEQKPITTLDLMPEESFRRGMQALWEHVKRTEDKPDEVERRFSLVYGKKTMNGE